MKKGPAPSPRKPTFYQIRKRVASEIFDAGKENGPARRLAREGSKDAALVALVLSFEVVGLELMFEILPT